MTLADLIYVWGMGGVVLLIPTALIAMAIYTRDPAK